MNELTGRGWEHDADARDVDTWDTARRNNPIRLLGLGSTYGRRARSVDGERIAAAGTITADGVIPADGTPDGWGISWV